MYPLATKPIQAAQKVARKLRRPQHPFYIAAIPFEIAPIMIAPVLPGETLKNMVFQSRVVTDPIKNPLIGWWQEYYWFYVKLTDLDDRDDIVDMLVNGADLPFDDATNVNHYHTKDTTAPSVDWVKRCLTRVVQTYFRGEGEAYNIATTANGDPLAQISNESWMDSLINDADYVDAQEENLVSTTAGQGDATAAVYTSEIDAAMRRYQLGQFFNVTDMTYEDFLRTYGVDVTSAEDLRRPELIRFSRNWSYPTNTVNPTNGVPASAVSWSIQERADKDRAFKEPGFIFGVSVTRPKVYLKGQNDAIVNHMIDHMSWLPATMREDIRSSFVRRGAGTSPLPNSSDDYWFDIKDVLLYGDQFIDSLTRTDANFVALPTSANQRRYVSQTDIEGFFPDGAAGTGAIAVRQDGTHMLNILGHQTDTSPNFVGMGGV